MLTWILVGVIVILMLWILFQRSYIKRLLRLRHEDFEEKIQERDEEKKRHKEEIADTLKDFASECFYWFFHLYYDDLDFGKSEATKNAVIKTFNVFYVPRIIRYFSDEDLLDFLREEHPDEFKGVKVKVPSTKEMFFGDFEVE